MLSDRESAKPTVTGILAAVLWVSADMLVGAESARLRECANERCLCYFSTIVRTERADGARWKGAGIAPKRTGITYAKRGVIGAQPFTCETKVSHDLTNLGRKKRRRAFAPHAVLSIQFVSN
jgi:hypothetical protein